MDLSLLGESLDTRMIDGTIFPKLMIGMNAYGFNEAATYGPMTGTFIAKLVIFR
jgi:hypothetical protein